MPPRQVVGNAKADVVARLPVFAPRIAETDDELYFFSSFSSVLPFFTTSGSAVVAAAPPVPAPADSSAFGITMCTSIVSASVTGFYFAS